MDGKLMVCVLSVIVLALVVTVDGACNITACYSEQGAYLNAVTDCKLIKAYVTCLTGSKADCGSGSTYDPVKTAADKCSSGTLAFSMTCLVLSVLFNKLIN